jgi:hypothetical protein
MRSSKKERVKPMNEIEALAGLLICIGAVGIFWAGYVFGFGHGWHAACDQESADQILEILKKDYAVKEIKKPD